MLISNTFPESPTCRVPSSPALWETQIKPSPHPPFPSLPNASPMGSYTQVPQARPRPCTASWHGENLLLPSPHEHLISSFYATGSCFPGLCTSVAPSGDCWPPASETSSVKGRVSLIHARGLLCTLPPTHAKILRLFTLVLSVSFKCGDAPVWPFLQYYTVDVPRELIGYPFISSTRSLAWLPPPLSSVNTYNSTPNISSMF